MPWISKSALDEKLLAEYKKGIKAGEEHEYKRNQAWKVSEERYRLAHTEDLKESWSKLHEERRVFEEYKSTEFLKMCREMNWNIGS